MINKILYKKVEERTRALEKDKEDLTSTEKKITELVEHASQEINSSLSAIRGLCESGLKEISDQSPVNIFQK